MPFIIQMVSEQKTREQEIKKEKQSTEKVITTTSMDIVTHDLQMMMPGSQPMLTGPGMYGSMGGGMGGVQQMGMPLMGVGVPPMMAPNQFGTGRPY